MGPWPERALMGLVVALAGACGGDPEAEVKAAVAELLAPGTPIPYPEVELERSKEVLRLAGLLGEARVERAAGDARPAIADLVTLGPADSGQTPGVVKNYHWLRLEDFQVAAAEVGEVRFTARFEHAEHFVLSWGPFGSLRIEVQEQGAESEYVLSTEGLPDWTGDLTFLRFGVPAEHPGGQPRMRVESVRLRDRRSAFAESAGVSRRRLGREVREALYVHGDVSVRYAALALPRGARLSFGAAVLEAPLRLVVTLVSTGEPGNPRVVFDERIAGTETWRDTNLTLPDDLGPLADVEFRIEGPEESVLFLGAPLIYAPSESPPRVLVYLIDTLAATHMSLYGYGRSTTPKLDALAIRGVVFENAWANSSWTPESVPMLMTSLSSRSNGVYRKFSKLAPEFVTLQEVFAAAGFATAAFSTNGNAGPSRGTDEGFDSFFDHIARASDAREWRTVPVDHVMQWMEAHRDRPTFVYVHTAEPHHPYGAPEPWETIFDKEYEGTVDAMWNPHHVSHDEIDARDLQHAVARYDGEVAYADHMFGHLMDTMGQAELLEGALVVVTADHGEAFGEHGFYGHGGETYPELLRIPLVFWGPGLLDSPRRVPDHASLLDVMPTLIDLFDLPADVPMQGDSLVPLFAGESAPRTAAFADRALLAVVYASEPPRLSLIRGDWKLDFDATGEGAPRLTLFDLAADPEEMSDLFEERPRVAREMLQALVEAHAAAPVYDAGQSSTFEISSEQIDRLRALGYVR